MKFMFLRLRLRKNLLEIIQKNVKNQIHELKEVGSQNLYKIPWWIQTPILESTMTSFPEIDFNKSRHFF